MIEMQLIGDVGLLERQMTERLDALEAAKKEMDRLLRLDASIEPVLNASSSMGSEIGRLRELHQILILRRELVRRKIIPAKCCLE